MITTPEELIDTKIRTLNNAIAVEIQKRLFGFGFNWKWTVSEKIHNRSIPYLYVYASGGLTRGTDPFHFEAKGFKEIKVEQILGKNHKLLRRWNYGKKI